MGLYMGAGGGLYTGGGGLIHGPHLRLMQGVAKHAAVFYSALVNGKKTRCLLLNFSNFKQKIIEYCHQRDAIIFIVSIVSI